ncbi:unnamed protein product [Schistosoma haematobium]|nr:unnamed protein product [Schistosoma haematobium]CAH8490397.1 unnamed protein product [Schistosoma haematobium]
MEASGEFCVYEVKAGDSLSAIAAQLGFVTPTQIARANHLPLMSYGLPPVFPGQRLIIPTAARANCSSTKIKHLPGVALRIEDMDKQNVDTTNTGFLAVQPFFYTTRVLNPNKSYPIDDDALERQFVKVNAFRVLESLDNLIDGVLLVTPESLCFDASQTAVAQKQAYIASHSELSSSDYNIDATHNKMTESHHDSNNKSSTCHDNNVEFSCCHIPQELLNLGLCIPLDSIIAMKTLVENDVIHILNLTQVYSFLLRAGVGSLDKHIEVNNYSEQVVIGNSDKGQALDSDSKVCHRRSLVEEMLESLEQSIHVPILNGGESRILTNDMLVDLSVNFPAYWSSSNLNSIYKSEDDGYCLNTVYRKCKDVEGSVLLLIRDTMGVVFGAVMSETMKCSKHFYGTGETFVFHWKPTFKKYCWTKKNYFFMRGSLHSFHIGGQSGRNAIWFDESLKYGCSEPTDTFDNPVLSGNLPDIQFSSLSLNKSDKNENVLIENNIKNVHVNSNPLNPTIKSSSTVCDSVPFIIDTFELWQLISC